MTPLLQQLNLIYYFFHENHILFKKFLFSVSGKPISAVIKIDFDE